MTIRSKPEPLTFKDGQSPSKKTWDVAHISVSNFALFKLLLLLFLIPIYCISAEIRRILRPLNPALNPVRVLAQSLNHLTFKMDSLPQKSRKASLTEKGGCLSVSMINLHWSETCHCVLFLWFIYAVNLSIFRCESVALSLFCDSCSQLQAVMRSQRC